jgi:hypothetical protein
MATAAAMPIHGAPESGPACEPERDDGQELGLAVALQAFQLVREMPDEARTQVTAFPPPDGGGRLGHGRDEARRRRRGPDTARVGDALGRLRCAAPAAPGLLTEAGRLRQLRALLGVGWGNHGIIRAQAPLRPVLLRRQAALIQMPP